MPPSMPANRTRIPPEPRTVRGMARKSDSNQDSNATSNADLGDLRFEDAAEALETIIDRLERGDVPLEDSLEAWERGRALLGRCREILDQAAERVAEVDLEADPEAAGSD